MSSELLEIAVTGAEGFERKIIVTSATPLFHTHRVLQWCIKPHQSDDTVAAHAFKFWHKSADGKQTEQKAPKSKLYAAVDNEDLDVGTCWLYESGKVKLELTVTDTMVGDAKSFVPRCVSGAGGNINLDATNKKLLERRFTKTAAYNKGKKKGPALICTADTTNEQIMQSCMNHMRLPLRWQEGEWWRVPLAN